MAQIISSPGLAALTGQSLGTGLGNALNQLSQIKVAQMLQQQETARRAQGLASLFEPQQAQSLANLPDALLQPLIKQQAQAPSNAAYLQSLQSLLGGESMAQAQPEAGMQALQQAFPQTSPASVGQMPQPPAAISTPQQQPSPRLALQPGINAQQATKLAELGLKQKATKAKEAYQEKKLALEEKKLAQAQKEAAFKETKKIREDVVGQAKNARQAMHDLDRMEELEKEGKLDTPGYVEFLKRSGLDIPSLMNPGSEEFNKIAANFQRGAKDIYGGRITNFEIEQFLKTIPSLSQSPEGRKRVIANLRHIYRGNLEYKKALKEVLDESGGIPPLDLAEQIDDKIEKKLDKFSELFKKDLQKPVPPSQNRLVTALQASAGDVFGSLGGAIKGAAKGAAKGFMFGGPIGGAIGGAGGLFGLI